MGHFKIINTSPSNGGEIDRNGLIYITFDEQLQALSVLPGNFQLSEVDKHYSIPIRLTLVAYGKTLIIQTSNFLRSYGDYTLKILSKEENKVIPLQSVFNNFLYNSYTFTFSTNANINFNIPNVKDPGKITSLWTTNSIEGAIESIVQEETGQEVGKYNICFSGPNPSGIIISHPDKGSTFLR